MRPCLLEPRGELSPALVSDALALVGLDYAAASMEAFTRLELLLVYDWAMREHLSASDAPIRRRPRPALIRNAVPVGVLEIYIAPRDN